MTDQNKRIAEIIKRTQIAFIEDTTSKMEHLHSCFRQWKRNEMRCEDVVDTTHRYVHGMKGLALTLSYHQIHIICEQILSFILQQEGAAWKTSDMDRLHSLVDELQVRIDNSFKNNE